jgi:hypothetical protein
MDSTAEIGGHKEQLKLSSLSAVHAHVQERAQLFTSRLKEFTDVVRKVYSGVDHNIGADGTGNFTGSNLCIVASEALGSGIGRLTDTREIQAWQASITLNPLHQVVKLVDMRTKEFLLIDPTYKQVNPDFENDILIIKPDEVKEYYSSEITKQMVPEISEVNHSSWSLKNIPPQEIIDSQKRIVDSITEKPTQSHSTD